MSTSASTGEIGTLVLPSTGARKSAVYLYPCIATVVLFIVWEIATRYGNISPLILPPPTEIFATAVAKFPVLVRMSLVTSYEFVLGFILAAVVGLPLGALIVYARPVEMTLYPMLVAFQTIPKAAIAPVFIVWLGTGITSGILIAFAISFFPIVIDTIIGLRSTQPETIYVVRAMGIRVAGVLARAPAERAAGDLRWPESCKHARRDRRHRRRVCEFGQRHRLLTARCKRRIGHATGVRLRARADGARPGVLF